MTVVNCFSPGVFPKDKRTTPYMRSKATYGVHETMTTAVTRLLYVVYMTLAFSACAISFAVTTYAKSHDPWLTSRRTETMQIFWEVGFPMINLMILLVPVGIVLLSLVPSYRKQPGIFIALILMPLMIIYPMLRP